VLSGHTHAHPDDPAADHPHPDHSHDGGTAETPPDPTGLVVLDIGGDIGAAVIHTTEEMAHLELEIRRTGTEWTGRHVAVLPRVLPAGGVVHAAVFPQVREGDYEVRVRHADPEGVVLAVHVDGGRVSELDWPR